MRGEFVFDLQTEVEKACVSAANTANMANPPRATATYPMANTANTANVSEQVSHISQISHYPAAVTAYSAAGDLQLELDRTLVHHEITMHLFSPRDGVVSLSFSIGLEQVARLIKAEGAARAAAWLALESIDLADIQHAAGDDWSDIAKSTDRVIGFTQVVIENRMVDSGVVPCGWTATASCRRCGQVPVLPGCDGELVACPWCCRQKN